GVPHLDQPFGRIVGVVGVVGGAGVFLLPHVGDILEGVIPTAPHVPTLIGGGVIGFTAGVHRVGGGREGAVGMRRLGEAADPVIGVGLPHGGTGGLIPQRALLRIGGAVAVDRVLFIDLAQPGISWPFLDHLVGPAQAVGVFVGPQAIGAA